MDLTTALGRLLTEQDLRGAYARDRESVARDLMVKPDDRDAFLSLDIDDLQEQARTLKSKRLGEVATFLPITFEQLGKACRPLFFDFAEGFWPQGHQRHLIDAEAFAAYLRDRHDTRLCEAELNRVRHVLHNRRLSVHLARNYPVGERRRTVFQVLARRSGRRPFERLYYLRLPG